MKIITHILSLIALGLIIYNFTKVNLNAPLQGESLIGIISIFGALCAILLLQILRVSKQIEQKRKN